MDTGPMPLMGPMPLDFRTTFTAVLQLPLGPGPLLLQFYSSSAFVALLPGLLRCLCRLLLPLSL